MQEQRTEESHRNREELGHVKRVSAGEMSCLLLSALSGANGQVQGSWPCVYFGLSWAVSRLPMC